MPAATRANAPEAPSHTPPTPRSSAAHHTAHRVGPGAQRARGVGMRAVGGGHDGAPIADHPTAHRLSRAPDVKKSKPGARRVWPALAADWSMSLAGHAGSGRRSRRAAHERPPASTQSVYQDSSYREGGESRGGYPPARPQGAAGTQRDHGHRDERLRSRVAATQGGCRR